MIIHRLNKITKAMISPFVKIIDKIKIGNRLRYFLIGSVITGALFVGTYLDIQNINSDSFVSTKSLFDVTEEIKYEDAFTQPDECYFVYYYVHNTRYSETANQTVKSFTDNMHNFNIDCPVYTVDLGLEENLKYWYDYDSFNENPTDVDPDL